MSIVHFARLNGKWLRIWLQLFGGAACRAAGGERDANAIWDRFEMIIGMSDARQRLFPRECRRTA
jgi:hypothetical protein